MSADTAAPYNHPDQPVRHSYPLAITEAGFTTASGLLMRTLPYVLTRLGILVAVSIITVIWMVITFGGTAFLSEKVHPWAGIPWFVGGMGVYGWIWMTVVRYFLYLLKCGHIAVLTELITTGKIGAEGQGMFAYGKRVVTERFKEVNVLFGIDAVITGVVNAFNRTLNFIGSLLPIPGVSNVTQLISAVMRAATTYIDETIFSYNLARGDDNPWRSGKDGLVYYCQNATEVLKTAVYCVILDYVLTAVAWVLMFGAIWLMSNIAPVLNIYTFGLAVLLAWNFRTAVLKPLFLTMIMTKFHVTVKGQAIDETWDARLSEISGKFVELKQGIQDWWTRHPRPAGAPPSGLPPLPPTPAR
jgi:hypothetical protein